MLVIKLGEKCDVCSGSGKNFLESMCSFCGGAGNSNKYGTAIMKYHICFCVLNDKQKCPICKTDCHHKEKILLWDQTDIKRQV